jgi:uncharacterized membrane protein YgdD (TMEM256/DUF423 family)
MSKKFVVTGGVLIFLGIILGAMAAHALEKVVSKEMIEVFEKGVKYQLLMGMGLLTIGLNFDKIKFNLNPFYLMSVAGVMLFCGFLYMYSIHEIAPSLKKIVLLVPFGGVAMIAAWITITFQFIRQKSN